jgi:hypothetical protein
MAKWIWSRGGKSESPSLLDVRRRRYSTVYLAVGANDVQSKFRRRHTSATDRRATKTKIELYNNGVIQGDKCEVYVIGTDE